MKLLHPIALAAGLALPLSLSAATISGTVTDRTTNKPATGDTVVLLDLTQGMQQTAQTTVNAQGHYSFNVSGASGMHLVKVEHDNADYYGPVPPNTSTVNVDVYDVAAKVPNVHVYADVIRAETNSQGLEVTESFFVHNDSKPPRTQYGPQPFDFFLPPGAVLEGATATSPGGMAVTATPNPVKGKDHYTFDFPVRPGETRFQVGYHIPYSGSLTLQTHVSIPTDNFAVMLPTSMSLSGKAFQPLTGNANQPGTQTYLATSLTPGKPVSFTITGSGSMPRDQQDSGNNQPGQAMGGQSASQPDQGRPGGGLGTPIDTPGPLTKYKGWILSILGLLLVIAAAFMLRAKRGLQPAPATQPLPRGVHPALVPTPRPTAGGESPAPAPQTAAAPSSPSSGHSPFAPVAPAPVPAAHTATQRQSMLAALKEELFSLETERLAGKLTEAEYTQLRSAFDIVLRRALSRESAGQ
jgi:hypothetical protein